MFRLIGSYRKVLPVSLKLVGTCPERSTNLQCLDTRLAYVVGSCKCHATLAPEARNYNLECSSNVVQRTQRVVIVDLNRNQVKQEGALGLLKNLKQEGYALTCCSYPKSDLVLQLQEEDDVSFSSSILYTCQALLWWYLCWRSPRKENCRIEHCSVSRYFSTFAGRVFFVAIFTIETCVKRVAAASLSRVLET